MRLPVIGTTVLLTAALVSYIVISAPADVRKDASTASHGQAPAVASVAADASPGPMEWKRLPPPRSRPLVGVTVPNTDTIDRFIEATGTTPDLFGVFEDWSLGRPLQRDIADAVADRGMRLAVTWEPWDSTSGATRQSDYSLASIIAGDHDDYVDAYARSVKRYPHRVVIRFMHEMNGFWYPWSSGAGNTPRAYVRAWRHVHHRFARLEVTNVRWMWAPNAVYPGAGSLARLYPGDRYVDQVGVSNYNWGDRTHDGVRTRWTSFRALFLPTIKELQELSNKPVWISEVGSLNSGGSKAAWITQMFEQIRSSGISGVMWFNIHDTGHYADWRIETEPDSVRAWARGFSTRRSVDTNERERR